MRKFIAAAGATLLTGGLFAQTVTRDYESQRGFLQPEKVRLDPTRYAAHFSSRSKSTIRLRTRP